MNSLGQCFEKYCQISEERKNQFSLQTLEMFIGLLTTQVKAGSFCLCFINGEDENQKNLNSQCLKSWAANTKWSVYSYVLFKNKTKGKRNLILSVSWILGLCDNAGFANLEEMLGDNSMPQHLLHYMEIYFQCLFISNDPFLLVNSSFPYDI